MAKITELKYKGTTYALADETARAGVDELKSAVTALDTFEETPVEVNVTSDLETGGYYTTNGGVGATVSTTRTSYSGAASHYWSVNSGDKFFVTGAGGNSARVWCFTDTSYKIISAADSNASVTNLELTANANGYLFINVYTNQTYNVKRMIVSSETLHEKISEISETASDAYELATSTASTVSEMNSYSATGIYIDVTNQLVNNTAYYTGQVIGNTVETPPSYNSTAASWSAEVDEGDVIILSGHGGGNSRLWCFTDTDKKIVSVSADNITSSELRLTAPANGFIFVNVYMSDPHKILIYTESGTITLKEKIALIDTELGKTEFVALKGKTVAIIGDSISTNGNTGTDANVPEIIVQAEDVGVELSAYLTYYDVQAGLSLGGHTFTSDEIGTEVTFTPVAGDVGKVIGLPNNYNGNNVKVWWEVMQDVFGNSSIPVCWSGSSITSHEASSNTFKTAHAWHEAQIRKCGIRTPGTMTRTAPDLILIYRGTNDFSHSPYTLLTDDYFSGVNWQYPDTDVVTGGYGYLEGIALTVKNLRTAYPNARIYLCTMNVFKRINSSHFPTNNGIDTLPDYNNAIRQAADFLGCGVIEFDKDGITFENLYTGGYTSDNTHPTDKGHAAMGRKAIAAIKAQYNALIV